MIKRFISVSTIPFCAITRRVDVQRCPAVPTAPNAIPGIARSRSAVSSIIMALLPPNSNIVLPKRWETTSATRRPMAVDPVNEIKGNRLSLSMHSPIVDPLPIIKLNIP